MCGTRTIATEAAEKAKILNATLALVLTDTTSPQESLTQEQGLEEERLSLG